jgi:hypothetical protein
MMTVEHSRRSGWSRSQIGSMAVVLRKADGTVPAHVNPEPAPAGLDMEALDGALRGYLACLDYDLHKGIESGEEDGEDRYPEEVADFASRYADAVLRGEVTSAD